MASVTVPRTFRRQPLARLLWALGVVALLLGDVWRVPHLLLVRHEVCGEHGELVHDHGGEPGTRASRGAPPVERRSEVLPGGVAGHHHDHCGMAATANKGAAVAVQAPRGLAEVSVPAATLLLFRVASGSAPGSVLADAPKQSPPV